VLLDIVFPASIEVLSAHADSIRVHIPWAKLLGQSTSTLPARICWLKLVAIGSWMVLDGCGWSWHVMGIFEAFSGFDDGVK
jgi:hypothetical protein